MWSENLHNFTFADSWSHRVKEANMWNKSPLPLSPLTFTVLARSRLNGTMEQHYHRLSLVILSPGVAVPFQWCVNVGWLRCDLVCQLFVWMRSFSRDELSTQALEHVYGGYGCAYVELCHLGWQRGCFQNQHQDVTVWLLQQVSIHLCLCQFLNLAGNTWREFKKKKNITKSGLTPGASIYKKAKTNRLSGFGVHEA